MANSYQIFFFRQFYLNIPSNIEEAAMIDGSSRLGIFFKIFIPMSTTPMVVIGVGTFMGAWNSFVWPTLTVSENDKLTQIMQIIRTLNVTYSGDYGVVIAASYWGKWKTVFQMISVILLILNIEALSMVTTLALWIALALTVISLIDYIKKNVGILTEGDI